MNQFNVLSEILGVTAPVFAMVFMGLVLRKVKLINDAFIQSASTLTYKATMPTLFFLSIRQADLHSAFNAELVFFLCAATVFVFLASWWWATKAIPYAQRGVFVQGAFRGNCGVVGFALVASYYGDYDLSVGGVLVGLNGVWLVISVCFLVGCVSVGSFMLSNHFWRFFQGAP